MLTKFETKSARVKVLSFHLKQPWILVRCGTTSYVIVCLHCWVILITYTPLNSIRSTHGYCLPLMTRP
ncbi:hypothetical protein Pmani_000080 [Petrolisthes manimaculis]|uniref:Uncharacterized protein n=1 Tax=Petrolisthes manimaculis TaxID=1843537 RepID=A0AAE1QN65_9EUCA|nr:hypothetical protein Pmani_000080 [Petrolisthes manimaculis]